MLVPLVRERKKVKKFKNEIEEYRELKYLIELMNPTDQTLIDLGHSPELFKKIQDEFEFYKLRAKELESIKKWTGMGMFILKEHYSLTNTELLKLLDLYIKNKEIEDEKLYSSEDLSQA